LQSGPQFCDHSVTSADVRLSVGPNLSRAACQRPVDLASPRRGLVAIRTQLPAYFRFARHPPPNGRPPEQPLMRVQLNSCPEIRVYDSAPIRCRTPSRASETLVRTPCSTRCLRNCSFVGRLVGGRVEGEMAAIDNMNLR
jgi:hypothetical protein